MLGLVESTERGFEFVEFTDQSGVVCSLQQSSLATNEADEITSTTGGNAIWLGRNEADPKVLVKGEGWKSVEMSEGYIANTRMHLTRRQVEGLIEHLQSWLDTGSF